MALSLFREGESINLLNVYNNNGRTAIRALTSAVEPLPEFAFMAGDLNCHSSKWDPTCPTHSAYAQSILDFASDLGLEISLHEN